MKYYELESTFNGYCYKDIEAFKSKKGICYIPEYNTLNQDYDTEYKIPYGKENEYSCYTYEDIRNEVKDELAINYSEYNYTEKDIDNITEIVFDIVDWQHPSSLLAEINWSEDLDRKEVYK